MTQEIRKAVIPAAGTGSRFYPLTRAQPKEMLPILDKPVIQYVVEEAINSKLDEILIIVGHGKDSIIDYFDRHILDETGTGFDIDDFPEIYFVRQREPLGLGDSLRYAEKFTGDDPFVVLLGDTIYSTEGEQTTTRQLIEAHRKYGKQILLLEDVPKQKIRDYGIIAGYRLEGPIWQVSDVVEKPSPEAAPSTMGITGTYVLHSEIYDMLRNLSPGKNGEYQLSDALRLLANNSGLLGYEISGVRYDIGTKELWVKTFYEFARKDPRFGNLLK